MSNSSIRPIDRTQSGATTPDQSGHGSAGNEGVLYIPQNSAITGASPSDCLVSTQDTRFESVTPLQRYSWCILLPQHTGPKSLCRHIHFNTHTHTHIYIYIYIVIHRQTVSFYQNSSVWLDTQDARSRDRNPSNFTLDCASDHSTTLAKGILRYFIFRNSSSLCLHFLYPIGYQSAQFF